MKKIYFNICSYETVNKTLDSLILSDDSISFFTGNEPLKFPLGAVEVESALGYITKIRISNTLVKSMDFRRVNSDGTYSEGLPSITKINYYLTPNHKINVDELEDNKIYFNLTN